ncbi:MAG: Flp pilus assembly complex ATPase component TadA [Sedimentisphaerales bacterium]|nr:Flp pilus assembly complex ATPase component TadA [Sedimentisphaerales bacterium]
MSDFSAYLLENNVVQPGHLEQVSAGDSPAADPVYYRLLRKFPELEDPLWRALARFLHLSLVDLTQIDPDPFLARLVPARVAHRYAIAPLVRQGARLELAVADPRQFDKCDEFAMLLGETGEGPAPQFSIVPRLTRPSDVAELVKAIYGIGAETVQDMLDDREAAPAGDSILAREGPEVVDLTRVQDTSEDAAIVRFVNQLLLEAVKIGASDIHLEPFEDTLSVRYRVDGMLQSEPVPGRIKHLESAIISRVKIMANLDIAEKRLPQDGQIRLTVMTRPIDVRVSVLPTMFGQGIVLRLLDRQITFRQLEKLGIPDDYLRLYRQTLQLSHGVVLVTGPTGSGKTTTLYASLNELNDPRRKIITVEDPIEYQLAGITQIQVKPAIGLDFANILRNILRHDPDVIMIGEIRDTDTARLAISAAMTGHLVFSTLHTNDAPSAPVRLLEMQMEPYLISSALEAVIAQRLVRVLCPDCRTEITDGQQLPPEYAEQLRAGRVYDSRGCAACRQTGYQGRTAIFEMFSLNDTIRHLILHRANAGQIRQEARALGMRSLQESGFEKMHMGLTSLAEVCRVAREERVDMRTIMNG